MQSTSGDRKSSHQRFSNHRLNTQYDGNHAAIQGRLNFRAGGGKAGGWSARTNDVKQWIQVDLLSDTKVTDSDTGKKRI